MSGQNVSYNLRPNKFVERQLFIELLAKVCSESPEKYVYVSLGGPQLEDQKLVHQQLGFRHLISLELDPIVHQRQLFNLRPASVKCLKNSTEDFVVDFDRYLSEYNDKTFVVWFDYASPNDRRDQLLEFERLLSRMQPPDILKITLNANPATLGGLAPEESQDHLQQRQLERLRGQLDNYLPADPIEPGQMTERGLIPIFCHAIKRAALNAVQKSPRLNVFPLSIFYYRDVYHQMITVTVCLTQKTEGDKLVQELVSRGWDYLPKDWTDATKIDIPNLTAKERLYIEGMPFSEDTKSVHEKLPFRFDKDDGESLKILEEYARHYRRYPSYFQVVL